MNKLLIGGAAGVLLIAGQAIAARLPDMVAARVAEPAVATAVTADPAVARAAPVLSRFDPVVGLDPEGVAGVGPLTEAETARLAVRAQALPPSSYTSEAQQASLQISAFSGGTQEICYDGIDNDRDGQTDAADAACIDTNQTNQVQLGTQIVPVVVGTALTVTALVVATEDDSDS